jgi:DNA repair protein RadA/Sms
VIYVCASCKRVGPYSAQCPSCGAMHSMKKPSSSSAELASSASVAASSPSVASSPASATPPEPPTRIRKIEPLRTALERVRTGLRTLDAALGGGLVVGSSTILGGDWGAGKSTLLLHAAGALRREETLYVETEELHEMVADRATRTGQGLDLLSLCTKKMDELVAELTTHRAIRTVFVNSIHGFSGDAHDIAVKLLELSRELRLSLVATSQIVKDGTLAGPNEIPHLFDTVLMLEKTKTDTRELICEKSRFAPSPRRFALRLGDQGWIEEEETQTEDSESSAPDSPPPPEGSSRPARSPESTASRPRPSPG